MQRGLWGGGGGYAFTLSIHSYKKEENRKCLKIMKESLYFAVS